MSFLGKLLLIATWAAIAAKATWNVMNDPPGVMRPGSADRLPALQSHFAARPLGREQQVTFVHPLPEAGRGDANGLTRCGALLHDGVSRFRVQVETIAAPPSDARTLRLPDNRTVPYRAAPTQRESMVFVIGSIVGKIGRPDVSLAGCKY